MVSPRVLLAHDSQDIRERVKELLQDHFNVVGSAQNGYQAIEAALTLKPRSSCARHLNAGPPDWWGVATPPFASSVTSLYERT